ncbi:hypothetical protein AGOR_G00166790 [Albula goreensis]|uniref:Link domain-containing protein n=1 Tax=Albula goreensis TaxID=1534307 RepID=A0A8T3CWZ1_9TELE|nr:hypothetical protein AGOR_G00166790 [Albula goreensis]
MVRVWFMSCFFLSLVIAALPLEFREIKVNTMPVAGVFEVALMRFPNQLSYGFNASQAREVCQILNVAMASKAQVEEAHRNGLETCRFGWVDEQIAVIPRIKPSGSCGQNQIGVIVWRASVTKHFDVFCFNSSELEKKMDAKPTDEPVTTKQVVGITSTPFPSSSVTRFFKSTHLALSTSPSLSPTTSPDHPNELDHPLPMSSSKSSFGVVPTTLLVAAVILLLLAAVAALWHNKMTKSGTPLWKREQKKEGKEVWKSTCEKELNQAESEGQMSRKNSNISPGVDIEAQAESAESA